MRKIILYALLSVAAMAFAGGVSAQEDTQPLQRLIFPELGSRLDSLSFYIGMVSGFDIADDLPSVNMELVKLGVAHGFDTADQDDEAQDEYITDYLRTYLSVIHSDEIADSRARLRTLPDTDPRYLRRHTAFQDDSQYAAPLESRITGKGEGTGPNTADLLTKEDTVSYYRGIAEGQFAAEWLEEVEFNYLLEGIEAGFLIGSDNYDYSEISDYLTRQMYGNYDPLQFSEFDDYDDDYGYGYGSGYGYYSREDWDKGFEFPEGYPLPQLRTQADSLSYLVGLYFGKKAYDEEPELSPGLMNRGLTDGFRDSDEIDREKLEAYVDYYFETVLKEIKFEREMARLRPVLDSLAALPGFSTSPTGLIYRIIEQGDMDLRVEDIYEKPELEYTIEYLNGKLLDKDRDNPRLADMMAGFTEGVMMVGCGGKIELWIPPGLTDDADGYERNRGAELFHAEVEVLDVRDTWRIQKALDEARPILDSLSALPGYSRTESGLFYQVVEQGDMDNHVIDMRDDVVLTYTVCYIGSTQNQSRGTREDVNLPDMMAGFTEGVMLVGEGGRIKLFIPPGLTDDADGYRRDFGASIFEADITVDEVRGQMYEAVLTARLRAEAQATLDSLAAAPGMMTTESGLVYKIIEQGDMSNHVVDISDNVTTIHTISYLNGALHDRTGISTETNRMADMMLGIYEGLQLIGEGGQIRLYIPPGLTDDADGYSRGHGAAIFEADITVVEVDGKMAQSRAAEGYREQARPVLDSIAAMPGVEVTETGLLYEIIEQGDMSRRMVDVHDRVKMVYLIKYLDGDEIDSSGPRGEFPSFPDLPLGFSEGTMLIGKGGKARLWIPPGLTDDADGYRRNRGSRVLYAEIEVLEAPAL